jgi:hypothetical protein
MRFFVLFCLSFLPLVSVDAQELGPRDIDPKTEDIRCVEKNYRHKTVRELEQMSPEELIDESERHWNYHVGLMDKYGMFTLHSYTEKIGIEIIPVLTKLAGNFASRPQSKCQENRFFTAFAIAADVDNQIVRLRTIKEGQAAISKAAQAIQQMKNAGLADHVAKPYNKHPFGLYLLDKVRGINEHDELMREMLASEYGVRLLNNEFVSFVEFLTSIHPTYPSWTPRVNMSRDLRKNKKKYHEAYLRFKKSDRNRSHPRISQRTSTNSFRLTSNQSA